MEYSTTFTRDQCGKVLERYLESKIFEIKSYSVEPFDSQMEGLIADQMILKIHYKRGNEENTAQFFLKTLSQSNPIMFEISRSIYAHEKESLYYETIVPLLRSKDLNCDYLAKSYYSEAYAIVLEDLSLRGFKTTSKLKPLDLQHCKKCLETIAKFHAEAIVYEMEKSNELGDYRFTDSYQDILEDRVFTEKETGGSRFTQSSMNGLCDLIDLLPENGVGKDEFKRALYSKLESMKSWQRNTAGFRCTLLHGDLWSNNFLYRYGKNDGEIIDCVLIDFQTLKYGPPAMDVMGFIFTNTRKNFRSQHQKELLDHYYKTFNTLVTERGFETDTIDEEELQKTCKVYSASAKIQSVVDRSITLASDEAYLSATKSEEDFSNYLFEERGSYIVSEFKKNEQYREIMTEDLNELRDMLFGRQ